MHYWYHQNKLSGIQRVNGPGSEVDHETAV